MNVGLVQLLRATRSFADERLSEGSESVNWPSS